MHQIEPHFGWLKYYQNELDPNSPFQAVEHNEFFFDRQVYDYLAHPLWDSIESESLLVKILFADYQAGFAIVELFGVWNDLLENDYRVLYENCLQFLVEAGITRIVLIAENILNVYVDANDYYEAVQDELEDGWICLLRAREHVLRELEEFDLLGYFYTSMELDDIAWRKLKPWELFRLIDARMQLLLP